MPIFLCYVLSFSRLSLDQTLSENPGGYLGIMMSSGQCHVSKSPSKVI